MKKAPPKKATAVAKPSSASREDALFARVVDIIEAARGHVSRSVNTTTVRAYWLIGREIVEVEQDGEKRAGYGDEVIDRLAQRLAGSVVQGFGARTLRRIRRFYVTYPIGSALPPELGGPEKWTAVLSKSKPGEIGTAALSELSTGSPTFPPNLGWSHYLVLLRVTNPTARTFYGIEAAKESWSSRELDRQIASLLFERLAKSRDKEKVLALARRGQQIEAPADVLKDPFVLEFLGLQERAHWRERDLEQAIIDRIEKFLLELGKGFCFVARQKRVTLEGDHFYVDLVFYNRLLRCFVLVDLKLGKLTHHDLGQMQMYVNFFDRFMRAEHEAKTIGIVLCSEKNDAMAKITLPEDNEQILAARYQMYLPTEEELRVELEREREAAERVLRLSASIKDPSQHDG
ncbi:MAG: PDDEXK nuclease domain-containing protein [Polyangiaceae bacterium]|nr:PDDEXK nuclease domain-containing protein [Polyangiaceae bacterium]